MYLSVSSVSAVAGHAPQARLPGAQPGVWPALGTQTWVQDCVCSESIGVKVLEWHAVPCKDSVPSLYHYEALKHVLF